MIRRATEQDVPKLQEFCVKNNKRFPAEAGIGIISEESGIINGYVHLATKTFIDPMVVDESLHPIARIRIIDSILHAVDGMCMAMNVDKVYFTASGNFVEFLEKKFGVEKFTDEDTYLRKV